MKPRKEALKASSNLNKEGSKEYTLFKMKEGDPLLNRPTYIGDKTVEFQK